MNILSQSVNLYTRNLAKIVTISLTVMLPLLVLHLFLTNYIYTVSSFYGTTIVADSVNAFLMIFFFLIVQIPFIAFFNDDLEGEDNSLKNSFLTLFEKGLPLYLFSILFTILFMVGLLVFIIPGIIFFIFFFSVPYLAIIRNKPIRKSISTAFQIGKKRFFRMFCIIFLVGIAEIILALIVSFSISNVTDSYLAFAGTSMLINLLFAPFMIAILTISIKKWSEELSI